MVTDDFTCAVVTRVGASGMTSVALADCDFVNVPVFFNGMIVLDGAENGPAPTPFMAATVNDVEDPAVSPLIV